MILAMLAECCCAGMAAEQIACNTCWQKPWFEFANSDIAMSLISRLNAKFGRFAVPNLTVILIAGQVFLYVAQDV